MTISLKAALKFKKGKLSLVCNDCGETLKTCYEFTPEEEKYALGTGPLGPQYCELCQLKHDVAKRKSNANGRAVHGNELRKAV